MQCELDAETRDELSKMAYGVWAIQFDILKKVKKEVDDGSPDWNNFHKARLIEAISNEQKARKVRDDICKYSPLTVGS